MACHPILDAVNGRDLFQKTLSTINLILAKQIPLISLQTSQNILNYIRKFGPVIEGSSENYDTAIVYQPQSITILAFFRPIESM